MTFRVPLSLANQHLWLYIQPEVSQEDRKLEQSIARECLAMRTRKLDRVVTRLYDDALRPYGIKSTQFTLLVAVSLSEPISPSELSRSLDVEKSTISRNLKRLVERGWVEVRDGDDRRMQHLLATPSGLRVIEEAHKGWKAAQRQIKSLIGEDAVLALKATHST